jgi:hypothetical protein
MPREELIDWLLTGEPWVVYRTLTDLPDKEEKDKKVTSARKAIPEHKLIKKIFQGLNKDGYWGKPKDIHTW